MALIRSLIRYRYIQKWCRSCGRETRQRYPMANPIVVIVLCILSCGGYLMIWLWDLIQPSSTTCLKCGRANVRYMPRDLYQSSDNQYSDGGANPPSARDV